MAENRRTARYQCRIPFYAASAASPRLRRAWCKVVCASQLNQRARSRAGDCDDPRSEGSIAKHFGHRMQLLHMLRHDLDDNDDGNIEQHSPYTPEPSPEQQRNKDRCRIRMGDAPTTLPWGAAAGLLHIVPYLGPTAEACSMTAAASALPMEAARATEFIVHRRMAISRDGVRAGSLAARSPITSVPTGTGR